MPGRSAEGRLGLAVTFTLFLAAACGGGPAATDPAAANAAGSKPAATPRPGAQAASSGELLIASPPRGWLETAAMNTPALRMAEYGPPGSVAEPPFSFGADLIERVTFEAQTGQPLPDPIDFVLGISRDLHERCDPYYDVNVSSGYENGYPTSVRLMICAEYRDSDHGQVIMAKAIQGNDEFYVITRRRMTPPFAEGAEPLSVQEMAEWTTYLNRIYVCDTRTSEHPCPDELSVTAPAAIPPQNGAAAP
jgi:hypothetical protein